MGIAKIDTVVASQTSRLRMEESNEAMSISLTISDPFPACAFTAGGRPS
jgi:hypothetical protein